MSELSFGDRVLQIRDAINTNRDKLFSGAASGVDPTLYVERFMQTLGNQAMSATQGQNLLANCTTASLLMAITESAAMGLPVGSILGYGYVVPYKNRAQFQAGYLGLIQLAYQSPHVAGLDVDVVHEGDHFSFVKGTEPIVQHTPSGDPHAPVKGYYAICWLTSGRVRATYWSEAKVQSHKEQFARGHSRSDSPWRSSPEIMAMKTVLRHCLKIVPLGNDMARQVLQREEYAEHGIVEKLQPGDEAPQEELDHMAEELAATLEES